MKKSISKIAIFTVILVLVLGCTIWYSQNIQKLTLIENIKRALGETVQSSGTQNVITTIDVTGIELGKETEHEHIYKTMYDETKHWEECIICKETRNEKTHTLTTTWALGYESCYLDNPYTKTCECGYSQIGHKPCVWDGYSYTVDENGHVHARLCKICNAAIIYSYYLNSYGNGNLYTVEEKTTDIRRPRFPTLTECYKTDGSKITCNNTGICAECKTNYTKNKHSFTNKDGKIYCIVCKKEVGKIDVNLVKNNDFPATYTLDINISGIVVISLVNGVGFENIFSSMTHETLKVNSDQTEVTTRTTAQLKTNVKEIVELDGMVLFSVFVDGEICTLYPGLLKVSPDSIKPTISGISVNNTSTWSKSKNITITGTENYCNTVKVKIVDDENNEIYSGETKVNSNKYSISCTPNLEAREEGRTFKAIVTDACENSIEKEFTISKIDSVAPEVTSGDKVDENWSKEKRFTAIASDQGIGNVQIAFNNVSDYSLATKNENEYSKEYKLTGDVYTPREANVYYKDELGNISTKKVTIDKIDNTAPSITGASFSNNKLNIIANDRHETEGEGSGIVKYRYITSTEKLENPEITKENSTEVNTNDTIIIPEIYKIKYVYIVAEDLVRKCKSSV